MFRPAPGLAGPTGRFSEPEKRSTSLSALLRGTGCLLALLSSACRATVVAETLPFHLAVVPFEVKEHPTHSTALLGFEGAELAREFGALLDGLTFTQVSVLALPPGVTAAEFAVWPRERREHHWIESARACRADLLLLGAIEFDPHVRTRPVGSSLSRASLETLLKTAIYIEFNAVAAGLALVWTVSEWGSEQRRHQVHVGFDGALLDLGPLLDGTSEADLTNRRTQLVHSWKYETDVVSTFNDRQGWLGHVLSVFIPGAFFPSDSDVLAVSLREHIAASVFAGLVEELEFRKLALLHGDGPFPFRVERLDLVGAGKGRSVLEAEIVLTTETIDALDGYRLWVDGELAVDAGFGAPLAREHGLARYELRVPLDGLSPSAVLRLEVRDAAPRQNIRTFTLRPDRTGRRSEKALLIHLPSGTSPVR